MAMEDAASHGHAPRREDPLSRAFDALFPEARRLQRRRRLRYVLVLLLVSAVVVGLVRPGDHRPRVPVPPAQLAPAAVGSIALPRADDFSSLSVLGGRLLLSGGPQGSLAVSGDETLLAHGRVPGICHAAVVDPVTLAIGPVASASCGDPSLYGEDALPIAYLLSRASDIVAVRIARSHPTARGGFTLGPVITTFPLCSDCQIAWIYGDGSLWLYNPLAHPPAGPGVLLRISARTGAVQERWPMPEIVRALLAVNANGLWLSPSIESGTPSPRPLPPAQRVPYESLYRISPGDASPQWVLTETGAGARWLLAAGDTASAAIDTGRGDSQVWTITGPTRRAHGPALADDAELGTELGFGGPTVAGNDAIGFYNVVLGNATEYVIRVKPTGRSQQTVATIPSPGVNLFDPTPTAAALDGSFFYLDPPTNQSRSGSDLHRVTPREG